MSMDRRVLNQIVNRQLNGIIIPGDVTDKAVFVSKESADIFTQVLHNNGIEHHEPVFYNGSYRIRFNKEDVR